MPRVVSGEIVDALNAANAECVVPHQLLCNLNPVLGKPSELGQPPGIRTICKTPMLYRIAARCDKTVAEWESKHTASYDTSGKGCSALQAALLRASLAEVSVALNSHAGGVFHDFSKFFDTIDVHALIQQATTSAFPLPALIFALSIHLSPRTIQFQQSCSAHISIQQSIIAGCKFSVALTRALLLNSVTPFVQSHPSVQVATYVDDIPITTTGAKAEVRAGLVEAIVNFSKMSKKLKLVISPKSTVVTSHPTITNTIIRDLKGHGITFASAPSTRDLGIPYRAGVPTFKRSQPQPKSRLVKTKGRALKVSRLARVSRKARVLYSGSVHAAATWGHQVQSFLVTQLMELEVRAAKATGNTTRGRCRYVALVCAYGQRGHPIARLIKEIFTSWFQVLPRIIELGKYLDLQKAWLDIKRRVWSQPRPLEVQYHGLIHNVLQWLYFLNWQPVTPTLWLEPRSDLTQVGAGTVTRKWQVAKAGGKATLIVYALVDSYNSLRHASVASWRNAVSYTHLTLPTKA